MVMNSFNHYAYGAVASWMFKSMAGIGYDSGEPGFQNLFIAPQPDERIAEVKASYDCAYGTVTAESVIKDGKWTYKITLPANTSAEIRLPVSDVKVNGKERNQLKLDAHGITYRKKTAFLFLKPFRVRLNLLRKYEFNYPPSFKGRVKI